MEKAVQVAFQAEEAPPVAAQGLKGAVPVEEAVVQGRDPGPGAGHQPAVDVDELRHSFIPPGGPGPGPGRGPGPCPGSPGIRLLPPSRRPPPPPPGSRPGPP